jgi:hypothetical protein
MHAAIFKGNAMKNLQDEATRRAVALSARIGRQAHRAARQMSRADRLKLAFTGARLLQRFGYDVTPDDFMQGVDAESMTAALLVAGGFTQ